MRPSFLVSPTEAAPVTSEANTSGTMIIFSRVRKILPTRSRKGMTHPLRKGDVPRSGPIPKPKRTPKTKPMLIFTSRETFLLPPFSLICALSFQGDRPPPLAGGVGAAVV